MGAMLLAKEGEFRFVMGAFVADGNEAAALVKDIADKVKNEIKKTTKHLGPKKKPLELLTELERTIEYPSGNFLDFKTPSSNFSHFPAPPN